MQRGRDQDHVEERFQRFRDERLERVRHDRHANADHIRDLRRPSGDGGDDHPRRYVAPGGPDLRDPAVLDVDASDRGVLMDVDAHPVRLSRVGPHHRVVPDHAAGRVVERGHDRELGMVRKIELRTELRDLVRVDHPAVDAEEPIHLGALMRHVHRALGMRERQVSLLGEQQVVVELLRELLVEPERFLIERDALRRAVVRAHDRRVAAAAPRRRCSCFSSTATSLTPRFASSYAMASPWAPPPTITTS